MLFPNGRSQHKPSEGGDLTTEDVRTARARQPEVAVQLAAFHDIRRRGRDQPSVITALAPGADIVFTPASPVAAAAAPKLVGAPRLADRPSLLALRPTDDDRRRLTQLVALAGIADHAAQPMLLKPPEIAARSNVMRKGHDTLEGTRDLDKSGPFPRLVFLSQDGIDSLKGWSTGFAPAPAWDEDHPEEASYRPFPLAPFLTQTASIDDPALTKLVHPDLSRTAELFETSGAVEPMRLRPGRNLAELMWSETWGNGSVGLDRLGPSSAPGQLAGRRVSTELAR